MRNRTRQPGYLLIELVAAVTLLAVAVAALLPSQVRQSEASRRAELIDQLTHLDQRSRLLSIREGPVWLTTRADGRELLATPARASAPALLLTLPSSDVRLLDPVTLEEHSGIFIDRLGRSDDYLMVFRDTVEGDAALYIQGSTGRISRVDRGGEP